jgi:glycosyltransferase involved in cell wall biosynthesis
MSADRLSVALVTPSFNQGSFLRECLDSVRSQIGAEIHHLVRDGGSTDNSVEILKSYGPSLAWRSGPDGGQVRAINAGLQELPSDICGYLNSDDVLLPGAIARVLQTFADHSEVDVIYGRAWWIDAAGRQTREYPTLPFDADVLVQHCFLCQPATFWRRRVHEQHGWFDPAYNFTFDYEFWLRLLRAGVRFHHLPEFLAGSREHPATKSATGRGRIFAEIRRMELQHFGYCGRNWWEQQLRYWRDESGSPWGRLLPGKRDQRMYRLAWWPYALWRRRLGGPLFYRPGHFRC